MLPFLSRECPFPEVHHALSEPDGLLAAGADLSPTRLIDAYSKGIFPWYGEDEPIMWWSPNPRTIFDTNEFRPSKSLCRFVKKSNWKVTLNQDFKGVIESCAEPRVNSLGTWITPEITLAYIRLHQQGYAHSIEVWQNERLIGGIYGVAIGKLFCGESMFSRQSQASKVALSCLIGYIKKYDFPILDAQIQNPHLISLGALQIQRPEFIKMVKKQTKLKTNNDIWESKNLQMTELVQRT